MFEQTFKNIDDILHKDEELIEKATTEDFSVVRQEGARQVQRKLKHYNLDAVIFLGYRVNSKRAVAFRQWATTVLRQHLIQGYTLNRQRLESNARELEAALLLVRKLAQNPELPQDAGRGLLDVVTRYARTFLLLQRYDEGLLTDPPQQSGGQLPTVAQARVALEQLKADLMGRGEATELFARDRGDGLPEFFKNEDELRTLWADPSTRKGLLNALAEKGFGREPLAEMQRVLDAEQSDLFDVLAYVAFALPTQTRSDRAAHAKARASGTYGYKQQAFIEFVLGQYVSQGVDELAHEKLTPLLRLRYHNALADAATDLGSPEQIRSTFTGFQRLLYEQGAQGA